MWPIIATLCVVLLYPASVLGKSLYVSGYREVMVRTGPSLENKILAILKTGQEVSLIGEDGDDNLVSTPSGTRGYVLKNYMTEQMPAETRLQEIEQRTQQRIRELEQQTEKQEQELLALREECNQQAAAKRQAEATANQQAELASQLQAQQDATANSNQQRWFITGAGVLLTGLIIGRVWGASVRRTRRNGLSLGRL